jgi:hypothetical protein
MDTGINGDFKWSNGNKDDYATENKNGNETKNRIGLRCTIENQWDACSCDTCQYHFIAKYIIYNTNNVKFVLNNYFSKFFKLSKVYLNI